MKDFIFDLTLIFQIFVFVITLYYLILSLFGIYKKEIMVPKIVHQKEIRSSSSSS